MPEKRVWKAARQRLLRSVDDKDKIGELRERGVDAACEGDDLLPVLLCVPHVV